MLKQILFVPCFGLLQSNGRTSKMNEPTPEASELSIDVELTISARKLLNMDFFSKSDPMVIVYMYNNFHKEWMKVGRTEVLRDNLNPDFATKIVLQYHFEQRQELKFAVYDIDSANIEQLDEHDFIGWCSATLGQIVSSGQEVFHLRSGSETNRGKLIVVADEVERNYDEVSFDVRATSLPCKWWSKLDPFLEFHKVDENSQFRLVYRTEVVKGSLNPTWRPIKILVRCLCGGDVDRTIRIRCMNFRGVRESKVIGETYTTLREIRDEGKSFLEMSNPTKNKAAGQLRLTGFHFEKNYSFLEYIKGGTQIHCTVAIDFTASNGNPAINTSLHYINDKNPNEYELALRSVVEILQDYDSNKYFPVLGFGAKIPPHDQVSHEFFVNFHPDNPYCKGVTGVLDAYKTCIRKVKLFGPTNFSPVIQHVSKFATMYADGSDYFILLILTDGIITDMHRTKESIIAASNLPLSIIIVGVGQANFDAMTELDADTIPLSVNGRIAARDIVQFVAFRDFIKGTNRLEAKQALAEEVLAEIPQQILSFMKSHNFTPGTPRPHEPINEQLLERALPPPYSEK